MNFYYLNNLLSKDIFNQEIFGIWIMLEKHTNICHCSYCTSRLINKSFDFCSGIGNHSWKSFGFKLGTNKYYLRWAK